jgi:hypothetical protein
MKNLSLSKYILPLLMAGVANAQPVNITFPATTPVSKTATLPALCKVTVAGYEFDSTLLGVNLSPTTCTAANLFPATEPGYLAVGVLRTGTAGYVDIIPPSGVTFTINSVTAYDYGIGNNLTIYATDNHGTAITYPLNTVAGVSLYAIPPVAGLANLVNATIQSTNNRFDITSLQLTDSTVALPATYTDTWGGNGFGPKYLTNYGSTTVNSGSIQLYPSPKYFTGTSVGGSLVYASATENFTVTGLTWTFSPVFPASKKATGAATLTGSGSGIDANGMTFNVSVTENLRLYYNKDGWHFGVLNGQVTVTY